jgi:uncharacterized protein with HEPN domain
MSQHNPLYALQDMIAHAEEACAFIAGRKRSDLELDRQLSLSLVRLLEVVGEAAGTIPPELRSRHPEVPWRELVGMRNRLIHAYQRVDLQIVWDVVELELPQLIVLVGAIAREEYGS